MAKQLPPSQETVYIQQVKIWQRLRLRKTFHLATRLFSILGLFLQLGSCLWWINLL